ncbi:hypothetical protein ACFL2H_11190, partial [Planctomycetota bacterium]
MSVPVGLSGTSLLAFLAQASGTQISDLDCATQPQPAAPFRFNGTEQFDCRCKLNGRSDRGFGVGQDEQDQQDRKRIELILSSCHPVILSKLTAHPLRGWNGSENRVASGEKRERRVLCLHAPFSILRQGVPSRRYNDESTTCNLRSGKALAQASGTQ